MLYAIAFATREFYGSSDFVKQLLLMSSPTKQLLDSIRQLSE